MSGVSIIGGVEAGGTKFVCAVARAPEAILAQTTIPTTAPDETLARVARFFRDASAIHGPISGFGVAAFGPVDILESSPDYGTILRTPKPGWTGVRLKDAFRGFGAPVIFDTDVNGAAIAEQIYGAGRGARTLAYVTVGTGIGVGVAKDGRSLSGFSHYEMGHIRPPRDPARDAFAGCCPFHGDCLEGLASGPAILARWGAELGAAGEDAIDLEAEYLSHLACTIVLAHAPDRIIVGGGVAQTPGLIARIAARTERLLNGYLATGPASGALHGYIAAPGLKGASGVIGALALIDRRLRNN